MAAVAQLYARAFADVASSTGVDGQAAMDQLNAFDAAFAESRDLREILSNPAVPMDQKLKVLDAICGRIQAMKQVRNFLAVLVDRDRMGELPEILAETRTELDRRNGVVEAEIVTARELSSDQREEFEASIARMSGHERIRANYRLDASLLGGALVKVGSTVFDGSVRGQLQRLKEQLASS
jgi:F-type H+-transporting ATPase subunit delta